MSASSVTPFPDNFIPGIDTLRARSTMKWTAYPDDVLPLWVAETDFATCPDITAAIHGAVDQEYLGYHSVGARQLALGEALSGLMTRRYGWTVPADHIVAVPDVVKGVAAAVDILTPPDAPIVLPRPAYHPFFLVPPATCRPVVFTEMIDDADLGWTFDLEGLESAFQGGAGSLILCNPYNPLGRAFTADELIAVTDLAERYGVRVISDEIHGPVVYDRAHVPTASVSETAAQVTVTVTAASKGWNIAGLKCAQMVLTNPHDLTAIRAAGNLRTGDASTLGEVATIAAYTHGEEWLDHQLRYLSTNLDLVEERLPEALPGARFRRPEATFLLYVDTREIPGLEQNPAAEILRTAKVAFNEGTMFGPMGAGHVRINVGTSAEILNQMLDRLQAAFGTAEGTAAEAESPAGGTAAEAESPAGGES